MNSKHSQYFVRPATVTDFVQVAIHETGHILGYKHSQNKDSVMFGTLNHNYIAGSNYGLHKEDVSLAKSTYGKKVVGICFPVDSDLKTNSSMDFSIGFEQGC